MGQRMRWRMAEGYLIVEKSILMLAPLKGPPHRWFDCWHEHILLHNSWTAKKKRGSVVQWCVLSYL